MKITFLGHAGLFIETATASILCDPWFNPAFFASWFPFPDNSAVDLDAIRSPDYLYVSHEHQDHFDRKFLRERVDKDAKVILPDFPVGSLERELRALGFHRFLRTRSGQPIESTGLRFTVLAMVSPSDGPEGDSLLIVDDGRHRVVNQNDSRPTDVSALRRLGPFDAHFLQFSGAIWYPMVYRLPQREKMALAAEKRANQQNRALSFIRQIDAANVFPSAGPPCFLDDELFHLNQLDDSSASIFCDQSSFLEFLRYKGEDRGRLVLPGSLVELDGHACRISHELDSTAVRSIFEKKTAYLEAYRARRRDDIEREKATWVSDDLDLVGALRERLEPLLAVAPLTCARIDSNVLLDLGEEKIVVDFSTRTVHRYAGEECRYRFRIDPRLVRTCLAHDLPDWVNSLFLSCRFEAERDGPYNEYVYNFFKCLDMERIEHAESCYAESGDGDELIQFGEFLVPRRCPHLKADLAQFGSVESGILTCTMHGWQFDLETGRCITSDNCRLLTRRIEERRRSG